jgi:HAE1 family hydrophobic/amphiphilic exporter-1
LAIGVGQGAELLQPMAITAIGGLIYATLLTLVFVPVIYAVLNRKKIKEEAKVDANN